MSQHRLAFCSFTCPDAWEPIAPLTWAAPGSGLVRFHTHLGQDWLSAARSLSEVAEDLKQLWLAMDPQMAVEHEAPVPGNAPGKGWGAVVRMRDELTQPVRRLVHLRVLGPVACHLAVDRPLELGERLDGLANEIALSLRLEASEVLEGAANAPVMPATTPGAALSIERTVGVPTACVALPVPVGWELTTPAPCEASLSGPGLRVDLRRLVGGSDQLRPWLGTRLGELALTPGARLRAWEHGERSGVEYAALAATAPTGGGTWTKPVLRETLYLAARDRQLLEWSAAAEPHVDTGAVLQIVEGTRFLAPAAWETPTVETWLPLTLRGGWRPQGDGVYVKIEDGMLLLHAAAVESTAPLEKTRPTMPDIIDTVRAGAALLEVLHEEEAVGSWHGLEAYRYALDARFGGLGPRSVRAVGLQSGKTLYSCRLTGEIADQTQALFLEVLERLRIPGMKER